MINMKGIMCWGLGTYSASQSSSTKLASGLTAPKPPIGPLWRGAGFAGDASSEPSTAPAEEIAPRVDEGYPMWYDLSESVADNISSDSDIAPDRDAVRRYAETTLSARHGARNGGSSVFAAAAPSASVRTKVPPPSTVKPHAHSRVQPRAASDAGQGGPSRSWSQPRT